MTTEDWSRLAAPVKARIKELGLTQAKIQAKGGPSPAKVREVKNGRATTMEASKRLDLDRVLLWEEGSINSILAGGDPTPISPTGTQPARRDQTDAIPPSQLWTTVGDLSARLGASLRAQAALFRWTQERLPVAEHAEHERMAGAAANPLMSASMDYLQQSMAASAERDPLAVADPDFIRLSETAKRIKQESEQADAVEATTESDASGQAGEAQEEVSPDDPEAAIIANRLKAMEDDGGLNDPDDPLEQRG